MVVNWRRHIVLASIIGILTSLAISYYSFQDKGMTFGEMLVNYRFIKNTFFSFVLSILIYATNVLTSSFVCMLMDRRDAKNSLPMSKMYRNIVFFINGVLTSVFSYYIFLGTLLNLFYDIPFSKFFSGNHLQFGNFLGIVLLSVFILLIVFTFAYHDQLRLLEIKNKEMEIALQKSQIESMKEQLSPHFLFNNLNVLISTIQEDPVKAEQFARSFSKIYRYVLEKLDHTSCALGDELAFIKDYVYLLNVRYDNAIDFEISDEVEKYVDILLPTLSLQILIENVVKHNTIPSEGKIKVLLKIEEGGLVLWNERCAKPKQVDSAGVGLQNLSKRSQLLFKQEIEIRDSEDSFSVRIPLTQISH
ncbi:histidine kinase [Myroides marinus]|uniref:Histidine kinase n=1 Tax=Myroides marinus TaxID=703342 RepID=A0A1H6R925_9FLAO|nr:histidine kinase [Myroides marinus]MDM1346208.1 histidine kinase [Myroides marinus]MDM1349532.1 histidine kinase [Myroides marinus]MDM1356742.1 histidine kinase [Myroides marinus]MDM1363884.1 histidine kinase [Myroides marinus]MDM1532123.1 histidine kinase [Myroides marinus]